jgi:hypothetical protein
LSCDLCRCQSLAQAPKTARVGLVQIGRSRPTPYSIDCSNAAAGPSPLIAQCVNTTPPSMDFVGHVASKGEAFVCPTNSYPQLSRLIGGTGSSPARTKPVNANTPTERLAACKRLCNALQVCIVSIVLSASSADLYVANLAG